MTRLPEADWRDWPGLEGLADVLGAREGTLRWVGGAVRDTLLGLPVTDVDAATPLTPDEVMARLREAGIKVVPTGVAHGTVTAVLDGRPIEITTLRRDVATDGRRATIAFTDDWKEDAARRDFTINALSADPASGEVHDYFDGLTDIDARRVRFIGAPLERIAEDHLRILRFFRFHARFGAGEMDEAALEACAARANDLMALSRERIADELLKLLALPDPGPAMHTMVERGIWRPVLPEFDTAGMAALDRLVARERALGVAPHAIRRLAALLPADEGVTKSVANRLRLSKAASERLRLAALREIDDAARVRELTYRFGEQSARDRILLGKTDDTQAATALAQPPPPPFLLKGGALVAMGIAAGPEVAAAMQSVERRWIAEGFPGEARVREIAEEEAAGRLGPS